MFVNYTICYKQPSMYIHEKKTTLHLEVVCNFSGQLRFEIVWAARNSAMIHYCTGMFSLVFFLLEQGDEEGLSYIRV